VTLLERFMAKVEKAEACWLWKGGVGSHGYGAFWLNNVVMSAQRASLILAGVDVDGKDADHLCRVPLCVRPDHLEAVTHRENILRGDSPSAHQSRQTVCLAGHELAGANLYVTRAGRRQCRACKRNRDRAARSA